MNLLHLLLGISLLLPLQIARQQGREFSGPDFPIYLGLILQAVIGNIIFFYVRAYEKRNIARIFIGYFIFFLGLSGSYLSGKSFRLLFFWEISTVGALLIYLGSRLSDKAIRSIVALFVASSVSMIFLAIWIFLPSGNTTGLYFLIAALLLKSAYSSLHIWLPEAHSGPPSHGSAAYSGLMINLPLLLFLRYMPDNLHDLLKIEYLILFAGIGVFLGGIASFFQKDIKRALAYSTIENSNFLWLSLLIYLFWVVDPNPEIQKLALAYLVVFYISIIHHSVSKTYQFLSLGYLAKIASSTDTDECKGVGRVSGLSFLASSVGSLSFAMVPGTIGFFSESTFLYLGSIVIDMPVTRSLLILPSLIFISTGLAMGAFSHVKLFLSLMLSVPRKQIEPQTPSAFLTYSLNSLGILILLLPVIAWIPFYIQPELKEILPGLFQTWVFKLSFISLFVIVVSLFLIYSKFRHKIWKRQIWDCGSNYRGEDVSIPGSVISDPLFPSVGRFLLNKTGDAKLDSLFLSLMNKLLGFGRYWIHFFETGELTTYLFLSSISLLFSVGVLLLYQKLFAGM